MEGAVILALLCISLTRVAVDGQVVTGTPVPLPDLPATPGTNCGGPGADRLDFVLNSFLLDFPASLDACSGLPSVIKGAGSIPICGRIDDNAARRACHASGVNLANGRLFRVADCRAHQSVFTLGDTVINVDSTVGTRLDSVGNFGCAGMCFEECYPDVYDAGLIEAPIAIPIPGDCGLPGPLVGGERAIAAVACFDRDECKLGVLFDCQSEFDEDCDCVDPCAANAVCTNDQPGWTCACAPGYTELAANDAFLGRAGCVDVDECAGANDCVVGQVCQNTIGSYVCSCNNWKLYQYPTPAGAPTPVDDQCSDVFCPAITAITDSASTSPLSPADVQQSTRFEVTCNAGFVASNNPSSNAFDLTCQDGRYCTCTTPTCVPQECGDPGSDPNAMHPPMRGIEGDVVTYTCAPGFQANVIGGGQTYTRTCSLGVWTVLNGPCQEVNLCTPDPCGTNSICQRVPGSFVCVCNPGHTLSRTTTGGSCTPVNCGNPPAIVGSATPTGTGTGFNARRLYRCASGYTTQCDPVTATCADEFTLYCAGNRLWTPIQVQPQPRCFPINCGDPGTVCNSERSGQRFNIGDLVRYTCKDGYISTGTDDDEYFDVTCQATGDWTGYARCDDVNECDTDPERCNRPSSSGSYGSSNYRRGICINIPGSYLCICRYGYNLSPDGRTCTADPAYLNSAGSNAEACDWYAAMSLCRNGQCRLDENRLPYCECDEGYDGLYCTNRGQDSTEVIAIVGLAIAIIALVCCIITCLFLCCGCSCGPQGPQGPLGPQVSGTYGCSPPAAVGFGGFSPRKYMPQIPW